MALENIRTRKKAEMKVDEGKITSKDEFKEVTVVENEKLSAEHLVTRHV